MTVDPDTWHEGVIEARRREQRVLLDGRELSVYTLLIGDTTKTGASLSVSSGAKRVVHGFIDHVTFGQLE